MLRPDGDAGQRGRLPSLLPWPYNEGLRIDEAMHPLTLLAVGLYGEELTESERRAASARRAVEVRLQEHQVDRQDPVRRQTAGHHLDEAGTELLRLLREREPRGDHSDIPRLSPPNAASANSSCARRCRSTATPTRWRRCTPAWTCERTTRRPAWVLAGARGTPDRGARGSAARGTGARTRSARRSCRADALSTATVPGQQRGRRSSRPDPAYQRMLCRRRI